MTIKWANKYNLKQDIKLTKKRNNQIIFILKKVQFNNKVKINL